MKIETKFDIGQEVYVIVHYKNKWGGTINIIEKSEIEGIETKTGIFQTETGTDATHVMYWLRGRGMENEECINVTKEEAEQRLKEIKGESDENRN